MGALYVARFFYAGLYSPSHLVLPLRDAAAPAPSLFVSPVFPRVRSAWRVSLARSLSYTRLLVEACGASLWTQTPTDVSASWCWVAPAWSRRRPKWSGGEVVGLGLPGRAAQEWVGCLGENDGCEDSRSAMRSSAEQLRQQTRTGLVLACYLRVL